MKHLFFLSIPLIVFAACSSSTSNSNTAADSTKNNNDTATAAVTYAYPVSYFSEYDKADPKHAQTVLDIWKDYDNNTFDNHHDAFADTVTIQFRDGTTLHGSRDSVFSMLKKYRTSLDSAYSTVAAVETIKPKGKDEIWVSVWGTEYDKLKGKQDSVALQEDWMFNKDGKIAFIMQYGRKLPAGR